MADVRPLRALRYSAALDDLVAPPYDVLTADEAAAWRLRSPHNVVHLTRPVAYTDARRELDTWLGDGTLGDDAGPAMFVHETSFDGRTRVDLLAALRLSPYEEGQVLPHERTHRGPKEDRLALLRATGVSLEPLWFLAEALTPLLAAAPRGERQEFTFQGERHVLRRIPAGEWTAAVAAALAPRQLLIADGHHRYETTLAYSREVGGGPEAASRFTLALLTDIADPGLEVLATHRVMKVGIAVTGGERTGSLEETLAALPNRVAAGAYRDGQFQVLPLEGEVAAVELHRQVIDNMLGRRTAEATLEYTRDAAEAVRWVEEGRGVAAYLLAPPDLSAVLRLAGEGKTMPQKTTYFAPKPPSGMAFHRLDPGRNI
ncbi:MAG: DUF1015 domain-containing protein [Candidatus Dormibacteraeota bacterium]|nr:DUF1015 domain-containing protein [Candidatus Dormibacteraeota bacterium]